MRKIKYLLFSSIILLLASGCYMDNEEELYRFSNTACDTANVTYSAVISPIMSANCNACHTGSPASGNPQVVLDNYDGVKTVALNGKLMSSLSYTTKPMPPSAKLDDCSIAKINAWINAGSINN